jgi:urease accessory protein
MRATRIVSAGQRPADSAIRDTVILDFEQRRARHGIFIGVNGTSVEIDLAEPARLRTDDALVLDDGSLIEVVAKPEPLIEARAADLPALARLAWHLGDRHVPVELYERRLRVRSDPAVEALLQTLGARLAAIEAPFEPEGGAYAHAAAHDHDRGHHHGHDHAHDCGHDHAHHHHSHEDR